jgi:hypothetical protein
VLYRRSCTCSAGQVLRCRRFRNSERQWFPWQTKTPRYLPDLCVSVCTVQYCIYEYMYVLLDSFSLARIEGLPSPIFRSLLPAHGGSLHSIVRVQRRRRLKAQTTEILPKHTTSSPNKKRRLRWSLARGDAKVILGLASRAPALVWLLVFGTKYPGMRGEETGSTTAACCLSGIG